MSEQDVTKTSEPCITHASEPTVMTEKNEPETDTLDGGAKYRIETDGGMNGPGQFRIVEIETADRVARKSTARPPYVALVWGHGLALRVLHSLNGEESEVERLQKVVADQALTISTLKDYSSRLDAECESWRTSSQTLREENERLQKALADEKSLTAATAEHTAQLEAKLTWFEEREPTVQKLLAASIEHEGLVEGQRDESCYFCECIADLRDYPMSGAEPLTFGTPGKSWADVHTKMLHIVVPGDKDPEPGATT
jgi:hypothetical protein